jgi:hypothetical protein
MMFFKRSNAPTRPVRVGERFVKTDDPLGRPWKVTRLWTTAIGIPHAQIEKDGQRKETRIIAVSALTDVNFYGAISEPA